MAPSWIDPIEHVCVNVDIIIIWIQISYLNHHHWNNGWSVKSTVPWKRFIDVVVVACASNNSAYVASSSRSHKNARDLYRLLDCHSTLAKKTYMVYMFAPCLFCFVLFCHLFPLYTWCVPRSSVQCVGVTVAVNNCWLIDWETTWLGFLVRTTCMHPTWSNL